MPFTNYAYVMKRIRLAFLRNEPLHLLYQEIQESGNALQAWEIVCQKINMLNNEVEQLRKENQKYEKQLSDILFELNEILHTRSN